MTTNLCSGSGGYDEQVKRKFWARLGVEKTR
jgi:hypothetical protein